jgi:soluble lytic murein transglycosylase
MTSRLMPTAIVPALAALALAALLGVCLRATAQTNGKSGGSGAAASTVIDPALDARDALRRRDAARLLSLRDATAAQGHPLASWIDFWELGQRLAQAQQSDLDAFYARWPGTYVEDRLRNDWLLELGRRRDWGNFARDYPRFRMNDDREVACYALLTEYSGAQQAGQPLPASYRLRVRDAWEAQRDVDDGCDLLATTTVQARVLTTEDAWRRARLAAEANRPRQVRAAVVLAAPTLQGTLDKVLDKPALFLNAGATAGTRAQAELTTLALIRVAANEPEVAAAQLNERWQQRLPHDLSAWAWSQVARSSALRLQPEAAEHYRTAWAEAARVTGNSTLVPNWSDDTFAWAARAALRNNGAGNERWLAVQRAIDHMGEAERRDVAWRYWSARAQRETAAPGAAGDKQRSQALTALRLLSSELHFYGKLAAEDLGQPFAVPPRPQPLSDAERAAARDNAGLNRALRLIEIGLRGEGVREWNYSLRGMDDRALLSAAARACEREVWDRCINTSDRTRSEIDLEQRFPMPFRDDVVATARETGLDPAYVYGLIRQESRFVMDARSQVGASGLMQLMPATARWTAKKIGLPYSAEQIADRGVNLKLGTSYLKLVLDDFNGSQPMAAAAYNAGPSRPRRWREGATIEPAIWAENIPFAETRDYVKKVLSNATVYSAMLAGKRQSPAMPLPMPLAVVDMPASAPMAAAAASVAAASAPVQLVAAPVLPPAPPPLLLPSLKARLGALIGPRDTSATPPDKELP